MSIAAQNITTLESFLAHAYALEEESVERYNELADALEIHHNLDVAEVFRKLAMYGEKHAAEVLEKAKGMDLPKIAAWEFHWEDPESPETASLEDVHYLMNTAHALEVAYHNELKGQQYYARIAEHSPDAEIRALAKEFADEEAEHLEMLQVWIDQCPDSTEDWREDPDPAHMPE